MVNSLPKKYFVEILFEVETSVVDNQFITD